ncbi:MAG: glutamine synthetase [Gammaproteobacteria bacterium]|nr:glutamine synthetase [Gammaproteobacteria bacterium]
MNTSTIEEARRFLADNADIEQVQVLLTDNNGVLRGKSLRVHELDTLYRNGRPLPSSIVALTIDGDDAENTGLLWEVGDMDCVAFPVPGTLVRCPWLATPSAQVLIAMDEVTGAPAVDADPRQVARRVIARLLADGYTPVVAVELEFYLLDANAATPTPAQPRGPQRHVYSIDEVEAHAPFFDELYAACRVQGLPAETAISEFGTGQMEITLTHRTDALRALDEAVMYRRLVKGVAAKHGLKACFMAKPFANLPGSGTHLHMSLNGARGANVFADEDLHGSPLLKQAIGGMATTAADAMALFAPHANSYRRFSANSYAPLAPTWGVNNRTVSLRIPTGAAPTRHIEHRICGADANPYLAAAAMLAGAHYGIVHAMDPGRPVEGDGYAASEAPPLPQHWPEAVGRFADSTFLKEYLGERFVEVYAAVKRTEYARFFSEVTAQDYAWYLHTV